MKSAITESSVATPEAIDHPSYYGGAGNPYEAIKVIEALGFGPAFVIGNALKYVMRAGKKTGEDERKDLQKAIWYLSRRIQQIDDEKGGK